MIQAHLRNFLLALLTVFAFNAGLTQINPKIDSMIIAVSAMPEDTQKVIALIELSKQIMLTGNYLEAKPYTESALSLAQKLDFKSGQVQSYTLHANVSYVLGDYDESIRNCLASLQISESRGDRPGVLVAHNNLTIVHMNLGQYDEALEHCFAGLNLAEALGDRMGEASSYNNLGIIYMQQGKYAEALKYYSSALKIREELGNKKWIADSYHNLGIVYSNQGNFATALQYYLKALDIREDIGDVKRVAESYNDIGHIYVEQRNYNEAMRYYQKAYPIFEKIGDKQRMGTINTSLGNISLRLGNITDAAEKFQAAITLQEEIGDNLSLCGSYNNLGRVYMLQENYNEAFNYFQSALTLSKDLDDESAVATSYFNLGVLSIQTDSLHAAQTYLQDALSLSRKIGEKELIAFEYQYLAKVDSLMGNPTLALTHYQLSYLYKDSLLNEANNKAMVEIQAKYDSEKKDKDIKLLENEKLVSGLELKVHQESLFRVNAENKSIQAENQLHLKQVDLLSNEKRLQQLEIEKSQIEHAVQQAEIIQSRNQLDLMNKEGVIQKLQIKRQTLLRNILIAGMAVLILLSFFLYAHYITRQKLKLQTLRNKIASDLHDDVGSTLSSISIFSEMAQQQSKEVIPLLKTIGESSRNMLDAMADIVWTINPENDQFANVILRMRSFAYQLLGAKKINFEFKASDDLADLKLPMDVRKNLYLIFKEASNNMAKYSGASKALFSIEEEKDSLVMVIQDNGKGFDTNIVASGNGLKNMQRRANEIGAKLRIDSLPGNGTTIHLRISV